MPLKNTIKLFAFVSLLSVSATVFAGDGGADRLIKKGDNQFIKSHFQKALQYYQQALSIDSTNAYVNYQVGAIYYISDSSKMKSLPYFLKTIKFSGPGVDDTIVDAYYYIGHCYALKKDYPQAIEAYNKYLAHLDTKSKANEDILKEVKHDIELCSTAPTISHRSSDSCGYLLCGKMRTVYVKNLGGAINSPYPEYSQVLLNHDSTIIFTSRRPASQNGKKDFMTDQYYEDIFVSHIDSSGHWSTPSLFSNELHFPSADVNLASVAITSNGKTLFIYHKGRIWESHLEGKVWSKPQRIEKNIRQIQRYIPSVFISRDSTKLFLVSDRPGGYGGKDIYMSTKDSRGNWAEPKNMGDTINTPFDEDAPFMLPDNKTLFFSSTGHAGLGGYDVFKSVYENGHWSIPENIGPPINSSGNDIYLTYDTLQQKGYFSSSRVNGGYGDMDIYSFSFVCDNVDSTRIEGIIAANGHTIPSATIALTDNKTRQTTTFQSGPDGQYAITLKPERSYTAEVRVAGYLPYVTQIKTPHQCDAYNLYEAITPSYTDSTMLHVGQTLAIKDAFYRRKMQPDYKNARDDKALAALIASSNDTATIWAHDTVLAMTYTPAQRDSMNPRKIIAANNNANAIDTTGKATEANGAVATASAGGKNTVYFRFNSYSIRKSFYPMLDSIAAYVKSNSKYKVQIEGNTDAVGSAKYNKHLSLKRAEMVAHYLERKGVKRKQIHIKANGESDLVVDTKAKNELNRRDDITIIQ